MDEKGYSGIPFRWTLALLFVSALLFTAVSGRGAEYNVDQYSLDQNSLEQEIAERTRQYQESLRQRAAELSPKLKEKIEAQSQKAVSDGLERFKIGELDMSIALPHRAAVQRMASFVARPLPFSGLPGGSFIFGNSSFDVAVLVTPVHSFSKWAAVSLIDSVVIPPFPMLIYPDGRGISYYIQIVNTVVLRQ